MNRTLLFSLLLAAAGPGLAPVTLQAALPTFTIVKTGLDKTLGNEGKGVLDPQVDGFTGIAYGAGTFVAVAAYREMSAGPGDSLQTGQAPAPGVLVKGS
jgi:hypothetical protein